jgi:hypothetical protein
LPALGTSLVASAGRHRHRTAKELVQRSERRLVQALEADSEVPSVLARASPVHDTHNDDLGVHVATITETGTKGEDEALTRQDGIRRSYQRTPGGEIENAICDQPKITFTDELTSERRRVASGAFCTPNSARHENPPGWSCGKC